MRAHDCLSELSFDPCGSSYPALGRKRRGSGVERIEKEVQEGGNVKESEEVCDIDLGIGSFPG